jgi:hypothetical protein
MYMLNMVAIRVTQTLAALDPGGGGSAAGDCQPKGSFFGFPTWYKYLKGITDATPQRRCLPQIKALNDIWLVAAAAVELLLRVAVMVSIGFVVWGGVTYILSQGEPDKTKQARETIFNALLGLVISIAATTVVSFIAARF